jgi:hypothetical protein
LKERGLPGKSAPLTSAKPFRRRAVACVVAALAASSCSSRGASPAAGPGLEILAPGTATVFDLCEIEVALPPALAGLPDDQVHDFYDADRDGVFVQLRASFDAGDAGSVSEVTGFAMREGPGGDWRWRIRWSPPRGGSWRGTVALRARARPGGDLVRLERRLEKPVVARVVPGIDGPLRSPGEGENPRYLRRETAGGGSRAVWLFGACRAWVVRSQDPDNDWFPHEWLDRETELLGPMREAGYNLLSQWMAPWEFLLIHHDRAEFWRLEDDTWRRVQIGPDAEWSPYRSFDQGRAAAFDRLVRQCEGGADKPTVHMLLSPLPHQCLQVKEHPWGGQESGWSPENDEGRQTLERLNGFSGFRPGMSVWEFFDAAPSLPLDDRRSQLFDHQANFWRYAVARWGHSRAVGSWVIVDELDAVGDEVGVMSEKLGWWAHPQCDRWLADTIRMFRGELRRSDGMRYEGDPNRHPLHAATTSYGGEADRGGNVDWRGGPPDARPDVFGWHWYPYWPDGADWAGIWKYDVDGVASYSSAPIGEVPRLISEFGAPDRRVPADSPSALYPSLYHFATWAAVFSGQAGTPMDWDDGKEFGELRPRGRAGIFDERRYPIDNAEELKALRRFLGDLDPSTLQPCSADNATVKVEGGAFALYASSTPHEVHGWLFSPGGTGRLTIRGLEGPLRLSWFDPWTGDPVPGLKPVLVEPSDDWMLQIEAAPALEALWERAAPFPAESRKDRGRDVAFKLVPEAAGAVPRRPDDLVDPTVPVHGLFEREASAESLGIRGEHNPYDPDDVRVDVEVTCPGGRQLIHPCFWYVPAEPYYVKMPSEDGSRRVEWERFRLTGPGEWRFRFSPGEPGAHAYSYLVTAGGDTLSKPGGEFHVRPAEPGAPVPVTMTKGARHFRHRDGRPFIPIGQNLGWPEESGSRIYSAWLRSLAAEGANCGRLWLVHYMCGTALEWSPKKVNPGYGGVGVYSQESAARVDRMLASALENGVYLTLSFYSFGDTNWDWERNPYCRQAGGWLGEPTEFFTDERARRATRNRLRYAVARYGWSPAVWAWELWNEVETSRGYTEDAVTSWHEEMAAYVKSIDAHGHLVTTSYRFTPPETSCRAYELEDIDFVNVHSYLPQLTDVLPRRVAEARRFGKPVAVSEYGLGVSPDYFDADPDGLHLHDGVWTGLFSGAAGTGMTWWWERYVHPRDLYHHYRGISAFLAGEDLEGARPVECWTSAGPGRCFAFALETRRSLLAWVGTRREIEEAWRDQRKKVVAYSCAPRGGPLELRMASALRGKWKALFCDTSDGAALGQAEAVQTDDGMHVQVPAFERDVAVKIVKGRAGTTGE